MRNNPYAGKAVDVIVNNTVGAGIVSQVKIPSKKRLTVSVMQAWRDWAETTKIDYEGKLNIFGFQNMIMRGVVENGEALVRVRKDPSDKEAPFKLQLLESDFLPMDIDVSSQVESGNTIRQGIEFAPGGKVVAYHIFKAHPGDTGDFIFTNNARETIRVPADEMMHIYRPERAGQIRGIPWAHKVMIRLKDLDDYEDAQLVRQKIAACFAVFVRDMEMPDEPSTDAAKEALGDKVEPGIIEYLGQGKTIEMASPPTVENYGEYMRVMLSSIASGFGVTYESLTGDYSNVNFSSGRMGWLEFQRNVDAWRWLLLMPQFMDKILGVFKRVAAFQGLNASGAIMVHTPPRREMIDPTKEVPAIIESIRGGILSQSEAVRQQGMDPESHFKEMEEDAKTLDELGLTLDSDARKTNKQGSLQVTTSSVA